MLSLGTGANSKGSAPDCGLNNSMQIVKDSDITLFSRYECKYVVSPLVVPEIREFLRPFVRPDAFAARRNGYRYPICSLYLDSEGLLLYQQTVGGEKNRFKLRARTYSDDPDRPVYVEVKSKLNSIVKKRRACIGQDAARALLDDAMHTVALPTAGDAAADLAYFQHHVALTGARPVVRVRYMREAYESRGGDPVRITIDTELMHAITFDSNLSHADGRWITTPTDGTILEIKFTERFPDWIEDMVRLFGLKQQSVPKYVMCLDDALAGNHGSVLSISGLTLPPLRI